MSSPAAHARSHAAKGLDYGCDPFQDHHGGRLWLHDGEGWFLVKNHRHRVERSILRRSEKVDTLRENAKRLYAAFPRSFTEFEKLGFDRKALLETPINEEERVERWIDSVCNASVPRPVILHTGVLPLGGGVRYGNLQV